MNKSHKYISRKAMSDSMKANHHKPMKGRKFTEEHKKKLSESKIGPKNHMFGRCQTGELNGMYGKRFSPEETTNWKSQYKVTYIDGTEELITGITDWVKKNDYQWKTAENKFKQGLPYKNIISMEKIKGKTYSQPRSEEHCRKISESKKGKKSTEEHKKKCSESLMGHASSEHQRERVRETMSENWELTFPDGRVEIINNYSKWCRERGVFIGNMLAYGKSKGIEVKARKL